MLEVCVDSVESAVNACKGGARRLELCSSLTLGGLTPSLGLYSVVRKSVGENCDIFVMIRPKPGEDYNYNDGELQVMIEDIKIFKENKVDGFVFGCLTKDKEIDEESCVKLLKTAHNFPCTFHRAFDVAKNPIDSLRTLIRLGFSRILTSGQERNAYEGRHLIREMVLKVEECNSPLIVVAGAGVSTKNLKEILESTKVKEYHSSARAGLSDNLIYLTDESVVKEMVAIGKTLV